MSSYDPQVRHTVIIVHYQCFSSFLPFVLRLSMSSPFIFGSTRDGLPRCSYENSNAFVRRPSAVRPISSSSVPRRRDDVLFSLFWPQPSLLSSPNPPTPPPRRRLTAETCITDSSKLLLLIALLGDIVESRVTVFTSGRRGGCYKLFKSFYYTMPIYILATSLIQKEGRCKSRIIVFQL